MSDQIEAIFFDIDGNLRRAVQNSRAEKQELIRAMLDMLGEHSSVDEFTALLSVRAGAYKNWADEMLVELDIGDLWTKWMLPDRPAEQIGGLAIQLDQLYRAVSGIHIINPEIQDVILHLFRRGYRLGLVSSTASRSELSAVLQDLRVNGCFETVLQSSGVGKRKLDSATLLEATRFMGIASEKCAFINDREDDDAAAARSAGFSKVILMRDPCQPDSEKTQAPGFLPDHFINNLTGLLEIFHRRSAPHPPAVYNASLSTMWALDNFANLADFFEAARRMGFAQIELNHKITTPMLAGFDSREHQFSSVHEPCPADIGEDELKKRDWLISSTTETRRIEGVRAIQRSIDIAKRLGAATVVIHAGHSTPDKDKLEKKLRLLIDSGHRDSNDYRNIHAYMLQLRAEHAGKSFESVKKSLLELLVYARPLGIRLGIENRYHYLEHPSPDELGILLGLASPEQLGFIYDIGHAETLSRLGFYPRNIWLDRFSKRIIGTHLHDVIGTIDHYAAGLGNADFDTTAAALPKNAFRTCEFQTFNNPEEVRAGLKFLVQHGCIKKL